MSKILKITGNRLETLGYVKTSEEKNYSMYALDEKIFGNQYGLCCDTIWQFTIKLFKDGTGVMDGGALLVEDFNEFRDVFYSALVMNGYREGIKNHEKLEVC